MLPIVCQNFESFHAAWLNSISVNIIGVSDRRIDISSSFVREQWGHFHSKKGIGFEACAILPVL
jgi:hypothetical protein